MYSILTFFYCKMPLYKRKYIFVISNASYFLKLSRLQQIQQILEISSSLRDTAYKKKRDGHFIDTQKLLGKTMGPLGLVI